MNKRAGFTLAELLIVIVVIGILAAIIVVTYNGIQSRAQSTKIAVDLKQISRAVQAARVNTGKLLGNITNNYYTGASCTNEPSGVDFTALDKSTDSCWVAYLSALKKISDASGVDITNLVDPWGRPYRIDENEGENSSSPCNPDSLAVYKNPFITGGAYDSLQMIPYSLPNCP